MPLADHGHTDLHNAGTAFLDTQIDQQNMGVSEAERGAAAMRDLAQLQRAPREQSIFRRKGAKGPNPLAVRKKKLKGTGEAAGGGGQAAAVAQEGEAEKPKRKRARVRKKGNGDGGSDHAAQAQVE